MTCQQDEVKETDWERWERARMGGGEREGQKERGGGREGQEERGGGREGQEERGGGRITHRESGAECQSGATMPENTPNTPKVSEPEVDASASLAEA